MKPRTRPVSALRHLPLSLLAALAVLISLPGVAARAQTAANAGSGAVTGRVFNPATKEYVRDAQIRAVPTGETVFTEAGGFYQISGLPAGEVALVLSYAGLPDITRTVTVAAGATATLDFDLPVARAPAVTGGDDDVVQLEQFTVTSEREGQAKVIMRQRASMDIGQSISSDLFGSDPEGNIGEFLRNVPGIFVNSVSGEASNVSIGGLPAEYTNVTVDGMAAGAANPPGGDFNAVTRAPSFELISLNSMESIDISRTISADVDASAPAGTINLRSKTAFDRRGTRFAARLVVNAHSSALTLDKTLGPDDDRGSLKVRPGFLAEFSTAVRNKYGLIINISESNIYSITHRTGLVTDYAPTAADPRPQLPNNFYFQEQPRVNHRFAATIRGDWRVTPRLTLGATINYNKTDTWSKLRKVAFSAGLGTNRATSLNVIGNAPMYSFETTGTTAFAQVEQRASVLNSRYFAPQVRLEYKLRDITLDATVAYSDSKSVSDGYGQKGAAYFARANARGINFRSTRTPGADTSDFTVTQLSGEDIASGASFNRDTTLFVEDGRKNTRKDFTAQANASAITRWLLPIHWKAGLKSHQQKRTFDQAYWLKRIAYTDTSAANISAQNASFKSAYDFDFGDLGGSIITPSGGTIFMFDPAAIARVWDEDQTRDAADRIFRPAPTVADYYSTNVLYHRNFRERIDAGYLMGTTTFLDKRLTVRAGIRYEDTNIKIHEPNPRSAREVELKGYTIGASTGYATTTEGIDYQFFSLPRATRKYDYDNFFPSASLKYLIRQNLVFQLGYGTTIRRPNYDDLIGVINVMSSQNRISVPNINLRPEKAKTFSARLAWYLKRAGQLSVAVYQNNIDSKIQNEEVPVESYDDVLADQYPGYNVSTRFNSGGQVTTRSMELSWSQNLGMIAPVLRPVSLRANYTRTYADTIVSNLVPHTINAGISYSWRALSLNVNCNWSDDFPIVANGERIRRHRAQTDISGDWRISQRYTVSFSVRNVFDARYVWQEKKGDNPLTLYLTDRVGSVVSLSVKGQW
ncbi:TonB-dependent receptor [Ereboglobus sp. PH5-10]|uniref:TonB-dependent receptor domain-containing protein n=1 Tax=Ereboglobus sp. PH5-10 TaxID=2940629 RepID=UPI002406D539|nr:TonB-dependent receptor [Ereboglobus sp. PH5-10]